MNYYNENDHKAAAWLRELITAGEIPPGDVDERSIVAVQPDDLADYTQCHFFAGIGGWSLALKLAGWPATRPVWTGSCPCQPFSAAGKGLGAADPRHLWPQFARLIGICHPADIFGEQVASKAGRLWLAGVRADLEGMGYAVGAADLCSAGVGSPNIRQRIYWVGHTMRGRGNEGSRLSREVGRARCGQSESAITGQSGGMADPGPSERGPGLQGDECDGEKARRIERTGGPGARCETGRLAVANGRDSGTEREQRSREHGQQPEDGGAGWLAQPAMRGWEAAPGLGSRGSGRTSPVGRLDQPDSIGSPAGISGSIAGHEGHAGVTDDAGDTAHARERERERRTIRLVYTEQPGLEGHSGHEHDRNESRWVIEKPGGSTPAAGPACFWSPAELIECTDGKARRVEPGTFPLAHGIPGRVGLLRGYGNAINPVLAAEFIQAAEESVT